MELVVVEAPAVGPGSPAGLESQPVCEAITNTVTHSAVRIDRQAYGTTVGLVRIHEWKVISAHKGVFFMFDVFA